MRFIYLSTTKEEEFKTSESTIEFFKKCLRGECDKFHISDGKINKTKFEHGEDIFFLRAEKIFSYYTFKVMAYCRAASDIKVTDDGNLYPYYFVIDANSLKIFADGLDIEYFQSFIDDGNNNISKKVRFTGNINNNKFNGPNSWINFDQNDSKIIMEWFKKVMLDGNIKSISKI